jgi:hypothetical protein
MIMKHSVIVSICLALVVGGCLAFSNSSKLKRFIYNRKLDITMPFPISQAAFEALMQSRAPSWMLSQIKSDLKLYADVPVSPEILDLVYASLQEYKIARFQIRGNRFTFQASCDLNHVRFIALKEGLQKICEIYPHLNADFIVSLEDDMTDIHYPIFVFAKSVRNSHQILIPDFTCFAKKTTSYAWTYSLFQKILNASQNSPWEDKIEQLIWRGATTGRHHTSENIGCSNARCKLCTLSQFHPSLINAQFTDISQLDSSIASTFKKNYKLGDFLSPEEQINYKYLIALDGNTCTYPGMHWRLLSNSVVFKTATNQIQWYYAGLEPWVHYIPIEKDLSNLIPMIEWAKNHDSDAEKIAKQASLFAESYLSEEGIYQYLCHLLIEYEKIYQDQLSYVDLRLSEGTFFSSK